MPYQRLDEMPPAVQGLPLHAQEIFRAAFNATWGSHAYQSPQAQEETAFRVAWAAVKRRYRKVGDIWVEK
jgi:cation transport regulator